MDRIKPKQATVQPLADGKDGGGLTGYTQLPYARRGRLRLRENRERGLRNGVNDKAKEGSTPTAVQKTLLIYTCGISCHSLKLCCFTFDGRTEVKAEREPRKES